MSIFRRFFSRQREPIVKTVSVPANYDGPAEIRINPDKHIFIASCGRGRMPDRRPQSQAVVVEPEKPKPVVLAVMTQLVRLPE